VPGLAAGRPELAAALDHLDAGDELVIAEWDRATRSMWDGLQIIKQVIDAGASIRVLDRSYIDLTTPMGRGFMAMMSAMAEDERLRIIKRTHGGRTLARANGVKMGLHLAECIKAAGYHRLPKKCKTRREHWKVAWRSPASGQPISKKISNRFAWRV